MHSPFKPLCATISVGFALIAGAQTTSTNATFQGYHAGARVRVNSRKPLILLNCATLKEIRGSNVVVVADGDRFVLNKNQTVLTDPTSLQSRRTSQLASVGTTGGKRLLPVARKPAGNMAALLGEVQQSVLANYSAEPGYTNAVSQYRSTINDYLSGKISLATITARAEKVLAEANKYQPERSKDPRFEHQIAILRDFVRRAKAGEKLEPAQPID